MTNSIRWLAVSLGVLGLAGFAHAGGDFCVRFPTFDVNPSGTGGGADHCAVVLQNWKPVGAGKCKPWSGFGTAGCGLGTNLEAGTGCTNTANTDVRITGSLLASSGIYFDSIDIPLPLSKTAAVPASDDFSIGANTLGFPVGVDPLGPADGVAAGACAFFPEMNGKVVPIP